MSFSHGDLVLVTGANGFLGSNIVQALLEHGTRVRGTVRSANSAKGLKSLFSTAIESKQLELVYVPDITQPGGFDEALQGVTYVIHQASAIPGEGKGDPVKDLYDPAIKGVKYIVESIAKVSTVKKLVFTSSVVANVGDPKDEGKISDTTWNPVTLEQALADGEKFKQDPSSIFVVYRASKALAERTLWETAGDASSRSFAVTALNPALILGPPITPDTPAFDNSSSNGLFWQFLSARPVDTTGEQAGAAALGLIDVRDSAQLHVSALLNKQSNEKRFVTFAAQLTLAESSKILIDNKIGKDTLPFDPQEAVEKSSYTRKAFPSITSDLESTFSFKFRPIERTIVDLFQHAQ